MPRSLDLERLRHFEPARRAREATAEPQEPAEPQVARWPSREPLKDGQISIKAPLETLARFRRLCREDRRTYADMLGILMDSYERASR